MIFWFDLTCSFAPFKCKIMNSGKYVFAQILQFVNKYEFEKCVSRYKGDHRVRELNCWNQFIQLFFGQLTSRNSLRDICLCLKAHKNKLYHLGIKQNVHTNGAIVRVSADRHGWRKEQYHHECCKNKSLFHFLTSSVKKFDSGKLFSLVNLVKLG